jgi:ribosomal protein S18 acetylase RimI-like enzyme
MAGVGSETMNNEITVRPARHDDAAELAEMWWALHTSFESYDPRYYQHQDREFCIALRTSQFQDVVTLGDVQAILAEVDGVRAGYVLVSIEKRIKVFALDRMVSIGGIFVKPEYRHLGIGRKLFEAVDEFARRHGVVLVELRVDSDNTAVDFYKAIGLKQRECTMVRWVQDRTG